MKNTGDEPDQIMFQLQSEEPTGWGLHGGGYIYLDPGESSKHEVLIAEYHEGDDQITVDFHISSRKNPSSSADVTLTVTHVGATPEQMQERSSRIVVRVYDKITQTPLPEAHVYVWPGSRPEPISPNPTTPGYFDQAVFSYEYLKDLAQQYNIPWKGYAIEAYSAGYESVYEDSLMPPEGSVLHRDIYLSPLNNVANFQPSWSHPLEYPGVWRVVPSEDWSYLAVGMGKHPDPWDVHPCSTEVHLFESTGTLLWSYPVGEEVWGIDIAPDGSLVAAGTLDGRLNVIDRTGTLVWTYPPPEWGEGPFGNIREVRFSHNGQYLCFETNPFRLFNAWTGEILWELDFLDEHWQAQSPSARMIHISHMEGAIF